jgi:nicotinamidase-related amidase
MHLDGVVCRAHLDKNQNVKALLVIDLQKAVVEGAVDVPNVLSRVNKLISNARKSGTPLIFIQHQEEGDPSMTPGATSWEFVDELDFREGDVLVHKKYRDGFADTPLKELLLKEGATEVVVTGAQSDYCVQTTALSALAQGFDVTVASDAHTTCATGPGNGSVDGASVIEFVNGHFEWLCYPERSISVRETATIEL